MRKFAYFAAAVLGGVVSAQAASIGVNIVGASQAGSTFTVDAGETAGYISQINWNNLVVTNAGDGGAEGALTAGNVKDSTGATVSTLAIQSKPNPAHAKNYEATYGTNYGWSDVADGNADMHRGGLNDSTQLTLTNVPYAQYDVYVFLGGGSNGGNVQGKGTVAVGAGGTGSVSSTPDLYFQGYSGRQPGSQPYVLITSSDINNRGTGNALYWSGNSANILTISLDVTQTEFDTGIVGFQIVDTSPVPEPASLGLLSVGGLMLVRRRSRV